MKIPIPLFFGLLCVLVSQGCKPKAQTQAGVGPDNAPNSESKPAYTNRLLVDLGAELDEASAVSADVALMCVKFINDWTKIMDVLPPGLDIGAEKITREFDNLYKSKIEAMSVANERERMAVEGCKRAFEALQYAYQRFGSKSPPPWSDQRLNYLLRLDAQSSVSKQRILDSMKSIFFDLNQIVGPF